MGGRIYNEKTRSYQYSDGSGLITEEQVINLELFKTKWKMLGVLSNIPKMIKEYKELTQ